MKSDRRSGMWLCVALGALIYMVAIGARQTTGLFVHPIMQETGLSIAEVSMALAVGQLTWGAFQPLFGVWADKGGPFAALCAGMLLLVCGQALTVRADTPALLILAQGVLSPAGAAAGSFPLIFGIVSIRLTRDLHAVAGGIINAGGSMGQFLFAPLIQAAISLWTYSAALLAPAAAALLVLFPARRLCRAPVAGGDALESSLARESLREQLGLALHTPSYLLLHAGFFTCGFHVAFLTTHLPGEIALGGHAAAVSAASLSLMGLATALGSLGIGILGKFWRMKYLLAWLYAGRAFIIAAYLLAPKTEWTIYLFALGLGLSWSTVPPTAGLVGKLFGSRYVATLFGLTLVTHQVGAFLGVWMGGLALSRQGTLLSVWYIDIALALLAALVNLPIREAPVARRKRPAPV